MADALREIGAQMANVMFNLAQRPGDALTGDHVATMDSLRKQWDAAVRATPPSPSTAPEAWVYECKQPGDDKDKWAEFFSRNKPSDAPYIRNARPLYGDALASRPRIKLDPELKAALDEAARTGATSAMLPSGGTVFINRGHDYGDNAHLECTACGGSGHIDDQQQIALASRPAEVDDASAKAGGQVGVAQAETRMDAGFQPVVAPAPEVDDEGLPDLPISQKTVLCWNAKDAPAYSHQEAGGPYFTVEQFRQGQRDAVAADRARRGDGWLPFDTAPRDGTNFLATNGVIVTACRYIDDPGHVSEVRDMHGRYVDQVEYEGFEGFMDDEGGLPDLTHWMVYPAAPSHTTNKEK